MLGLIASAGNTIEYIYRSQELRAFFIDTRAPPLIIGRRSSPINRPHANLIITRIADRTSNQRVCLEEGDVALSNIPETPMPIVGTTTYRVRGEGSGAGCICTDTVNTVCERTHGGRAWTVAQSEVCVCVCERTNTGARKMLSARASNFVVEGQSGSAFPERAAALYVKTTVKCARWSTVMSRVRGRSVLSDSGWRTRASRWFTLCERNAQRFFSLSPSRRIV